MPIISTSLTLLVVITCLTLANWQHNRAQDKQLRLDNISALQAKGIISWKELQHIPKNLNKSGITVQLNGRLQSKQYWLLDNRVFEKMVGFDVLALFYPDQSQQAIIVNLGWVKATQNRAQVPEVNLPSQKISLQVQLKEGDLAGFYLQQETLNNTAWPKQIQYVDLAIMQQQSEAKLTDFIAYSNEAKFSLQPHYTPVVMPPEKHLAYALQWFLLAIIALGVFVFALQRHSEDKLIIGVRNEKQ